MTFWTGFVLFLEGLGGSCCAFNDLVPAPLKGKYLVAQWFYPGSGSMCHGITYYKVPFSIDSFELPLCDKVCTAFI